MEALKNNGEVQSSAVTDDDSRQKGFLAPKYMGTIADKEDMSVLGKSQVLRVRSTTYMNWISASVPLRTSIDL